MSATLPQPMRALNRANEVRFARVELKRQIAAGELDAAAVILNPPPEAENWAIAEVLTSQYRWGDDRTRRFLGCLKIGEHRPLGALTERQRRELADILARPGAGR